MDGDVLLHPRGPLPPSVYWRRRITVVAGILLFLFVLRACAFGGDGKKQPSTTSTTPVSTAGTTPGAATSPKPAASATSRPATSAPASVVPPDPSTPCAKSAIKVTAAANAGSFAAGVEPELTLTVTNTGQTACTRDLGPAQTELRVTSGPDRIWSSDDCAATAAANPTVLKPDETKTFKVTWKRTRSKPCDGTKPAALAGNYRVFGRVGDITSAPDAFRLA